MKNQNGFTTLEALLMFIIVAIIVGTGLYVLQAKRNTSRAIFDASKSQPGISPDRTVINASKGVVDEAPYRTTFSQLPSKLQSAVSAEIRKAAPNCINSSGQIVSQLDNTKLLNPDVIYDSTGYAQINIGCGDGAAGIFASEKGVWKFLAATQFEYSCDLLKKYNFPSALLALNSPDVRCLDKNNNETAYSG